MAVWYQQRYAVPTAARAKKRGQHEFARVIYDAFFQLLWNSLHGFVAIGQVGCSKRSNSKEAVSNM